MRSVASGVVELLRPPNVFTAVADSLAGLALLRAGAVWGDPGLWCLGASAFLYLGGMALNDYFDREIDAVERPERPIPSGVVPAGLAAGIGFGLLALGIACAALAGTGPLLVAIGLAASVACYDALTKDTPLGFANMGFCRALNFAMPMALEPSVFASPLIIAPLCLFAYITTITYLSRDEVAGNAQARARRAVRAFAGVGALLAFGVLVLGGHPVGIGILFVAFWRGTQIFGPLWNDPSGPTTGRAIGGGILSIPLLDAALVGAAGHALPAFAIVALMAPAFALKRHYSPT